MNKTRVFVVPNNDLEALTIISMLQEKGEEVLVTEQKWGASWNGLEPHIKNLLALNRNRI